MEGPIQAAELGFEETFKRFERLATLLEEVNIITEELKENDDIDLKFKIELT